MSSHELALALRVPAIRINDIVNEKRGIPADTALRLSRYFGTTSRFWMNMQASWELEVAEDQLGKAVERDVLPRNAAGGGVAPETLQARWSQCRRSALPPAGAGWNRMRHLRRDRGLRALPHGRGSASGLGSVDGNL
jgi:addiction module HigA family antidote